MKKKCGTCGHEGYSSTVITKGRDPETCQDCGATIDEDDLSGYIYPTTETYRTPLKDPVFWLIVLFSVIIAGLSTAATRCIT